MSCPDAHGGFGSPFMPAEGHGSPVTHGTITEDRGKNKVCQQSQPIIDSEYLGE